MAEKIIMATQNKGKLAEINELVKEFGIEIQSMADAGLDGLDIKEDGKTCVENSFIKANTVVQITGIPAIADDAGLFVEALGGAPGIYSARYAGIHGDDAANRKKLLQELAKINAFTKEERKAYFTCVITLVYPDGQKIVCEGFCHGSISLSEQGDQGFGYDSVFIPDGYECTFAQMGVEQKNKFSHRAKALAELKEKLKK